MGKKYIIELKDNTAWLQWVNVADDGQVRFDFKYPEDLTPYTEPDIEKVRKEAYDKGYTDAAYNCHERCAFLDDEKKKAYAEGYEEGMQLSIDDAKLKEAYQRGLNDAWDAARKIILAPEDGGISGSKVDEIFHVAYYRDALKYCSASEAIEKLKSYEQEKEEQIQVGDEVTGTYTGGDETEPFVIIRKIPEIHPTYYFGIYSKSGEFCQGGLKLKKTGRHFPELVKVLQKMKETE